MTDAHACPGYTCERPECVRRQRDELRERCDRLHADLRMASIRHGSGDALYCLRCLGIWRSGEPERHAEGCLAA